MKESLVTPSAAGQSKPSSRASTTARRPGRPTREQAEALRECILEAALSTFMARGFEAASMEGIARQAGVAKITLYRHFESKERLFVAVARWGQLSVRNRLGELADTRAPLELVLRQIIEKLYVGYTDPRYLEVVRTVIAESRRFPKLGRAMLNDNKYMMEPLVIYLQHLKDTGQINIDSAYDAATQLSGLASGAIRYVLISPSHHPISRQHWVESLTQLFTRAWQTERP